MKRILLSIISVVWLLAVSPAAFAQDCSNWTNGHLVGTYSMSGGGYIDPSKLLPGAAAGTVPTYSVGALALDGKGGGKGWLAVNTGGTQFTFESVAITYAMQPNCSVQMTFTWKVKELGVTFPPFTRIGVILPAPSSLQVHSILAGSPPGQMPAPGFEIGVAHRISMQY